jgi:hypothetical protein
MRLLRLTILLTAVIVLGATEAQAAMLTALASFGGGDGYLPPGDRAYLTSDNTQRGIAYNPATGHVLIANRAGGSSINIIDGTTGADLGALQGIGDVTGGTFAINMIGAADDGAIYVGNLTTNSTTSPFKIYRWADESSAAPTVAFSGDPLAGSRIGDSFDVRGSGTGTQLVGGYGNAPAVAGNNSFAVFTTADGSSYTSTHIAVGTNPPAAGDFRLGITFLDSDTVIGSQAAPGPGRVVDITGVGTGTLNTSFSLDAAFINPMDYAVLGGVPVLAAVNTATDGESKLWVYDMTNPALPVLLASLDNLPGAAVANGNGVGQVKIRDTGGGNAIIYALNANNGIQAFELSGVPEPGSALLLTLGAAVLGVARRRVRT